MSFAVVIYDEKLRCFMPAYSTEPPSGWIVPGRGENKQHLLVPRGDYARGTHAEVMELIENWGYKPNQIVRDKFFWTHDLRQEHPKGMIVIYNGGEDRRYPISCDSIYPADWNILTYRAHTAWADQFKDIPKAIGLVVRQGRNSFLPLLFKLDETAAPDSFYTKHRYRYLERTERPLATLAAAIRQFERMTYRPSRILGTEALPVSNFEEADIKLFVGTGRLAGQPDIKIKETDIFAVDVTPLPGAGSFKGLIAA
ncbi:MAG: hypothetical protein EBQ96_04585 [Proteobacteria bacterium]|nr:hypothetical protein [Pseudomonadota bacterium]